MGKPVENVNNEKIDEVIEVEAKATAKNEAEEIKKQEVEAKATAKKLKEDMVEIKIPIDQLNPKDLVVPVIINGYIWSIERGKEVKVPREVKHILEDAKYI